MQVYDEKLKQRAEIELQQLLASNPHLENLKIRSQKHGHGYQYYISGLNNEKKWVYLPKKSRFLAEKIIRRDYLLQVIRCCVAWETFCRRLSKLQLDRPENIEDLHLKYPGRTPFITPFILSDEEYVREWKNQKYETKIAAGSRMYETEGGEKVRSKSEKIIADLLLKLHIPYHYEKPLALSSGRIVHPDFTLLDIRTRKEVYFEHFGMLDKSQYVQGMVWKLDVYAKDGLFPGEKLLIFWESGDVALNISNLERMLRSFFCKKQ